MCLHNNPTTKQNMSLLFGQHIFIKAKIKKEKLGWIFILSGSEVKTAHKHFHDFHHPLQHSKVAFHPVEYIQTFRSSLQNAEEIIRW